MMEGNMAKPSEAPSKASRDDLDPAIVEALTRGAWRDPFAVLGPHEQGRGLIIRAFMPDATRLGIIDETGMERAELALIHGDGLFAGPAPLKRPWRYRLRAETAQGRIEFEDPYR